MPRIKKLKYIPCNDKDDLCYGFSDPNTREICVNVGYIWGKYKDVDKFINNFIGTYIHEALHLAIDSQSPKRNKGTFYGEEKIVRRMLHERFPPKIRYYYAHDSENKR
jgi:hypothetical protein